jgi:hypothetical protein
MITLRPTVTLAKRLKVELPPENVPVREKHTDWCAHGFTANRHRYLILTNTYSLLSVVTHARGLTTEGAFISHGLSAIRHYLHDSGRQFALERFVIPAEAEVRLVRLADRAVLGSINELIFLAKCHLIEGGLSPAETSHRLGEVPMSLLWKRGPATPADTFDQMPAEF